MSSRDELFLCSLECYFGVYFPRCFATREINTKITVSWPLKQFVTRVHTLFSMHVIVGKNHFNAYRLNVIFTSIILSSLPPFLVKICNRCLNYLIVQHSYYAYIDRTAFWHSQYNSYNHTICWQIIEVMSAYANTTNGNWLTCYA